MEALFEHRLTEGNILFRHARGVSLRSGKEFHLYSEIILLLSDNAELISENQHKRLPAGTLLVIPKETYHQVIIHGDPKTYHRCVLNFGDSAAADLPNGIRVLSPNSGVSYLFSVLQAAAEAPDLAVPTLLSSTLTLLLHELPRLTEAPASHGAADERIRAAVDYVGTHLGETLTLETVAQACRVSPSTLSHLFKREMRIPLHKYIVQKRLIAAHRSIAAGVPATEAAYTYGFGDYSGFYKQYKALFGISPAQTKAR